jgi:long-subunit fatty acid transport protein
MRARVAALLGASLSGALTLATLPAVASPSTQRGFGARAGSLAAANGADLDDASAVVGNPSGISHAPGTLVSVGYENHASSLEHDGAEAPLETIQTVEVGLVVPGEILTIPVGFGLALALPDGRFSKLRQVEPTEPYFVLDDAVPRLLDLAVGVAVEPLSRLSLGGGVGFVSSLEGAFRIRGTAASADGMGAEYDSSLTHSVDADLLSSRYPILGLGYVPVDPISLGLSYRGAVKVNQRIEGTLNGDLAIGPLAVPVTYAFTTDAIVAYSPPELALSATVRPLERLALHASLLFRRYSTFPSPYTRTASRLVTNLPPGLGLLPPDDPGTPPPPARFRDRFVPRVGLEREFGLGPASSIAARGGYAYEHSPVPVSQRETLLFDMNRHVFALGGGLRLRRPLQPFAELRLDLAVELVHGARRAFESGVTREPTRHRAEGDLLALGATLGVFFDDDDPDQASAGAAGAR